MHESRYGWTTDRSARRARRGRWIAASAAAALLLACYAWSARSESGDQQSRTDSNDQSRVALASETAALPTSVETNPSEPTWHCNPIREFVVEAPQVDPCQFVSPAQPHCITGIDCVEGGNCGELGWKSTSIVPFQIYAQGEYVGHARIPHVPEYRLRVDDQLEFVYRVTRNESPEPYKLNVGDIVDVESFTDEALNRELVIQPDGTITLRLLGQVKAARLTVAQLTEELNKLYLKYYKEPAITVTPLKVNTKLEDLRAAVDARAGQGGQNIRARVTPEGTIQLPVLGSVPVQLLTIDECRRELNERYAQEIEGIEITPVLQVRAPRYCYVLGEVKQPGRYTLEAPTTVMQAIALAQGWNVGANLRQVVVFRRGDDWRLIATMLDLRGALYGKRPCPADEIWLNDTDLVVVPKSPVLVVDDMINLVFTRGIYGVVPFSANVTYTNISSVLD